MWNFLFQLLKLTVSKFKAFEESWPNLQPVQHFSFLHVGSVSIGFQNHHPSLCYVQFTFR